MRSLPIRLALLLALTTAPPALAQEAGRTFHEDETEGFRFKPLAEFQAVPLQPGQGSSGLVLRMSQDGHRLYAYAIGDPASRGGAEGRSSAAAKRRDITRVLGNSYGFRSVRDKPTLDESVEVGDLTARRRVWDVSETVSFEAWTYPLEHADVSLVYIVTEERSPRWSKAIEKSARSFEAIERVVFEPAGPGVQLTYEEQLERAKAEAAKTPGWRAVDTPSRKFIIVTSAKKERFVKEVIRHLEVARKEFEDDFPPPDDFDAVSIVRVCGSREEFAQYGSVSAQTAGYFNPRSAELVLYDAVQIDRNMTYAVVVHEAFHQYCHYLFGQSEAHRWFDEGHGDYYGGMDVSGSRAKITPKMPAGLDRLSVIREMVRNEGAGSYRLTPMAEHIHFNHPQWQSRGISSYAQSWALIYYLRQGAQRKVNRKVWRKEYAEIIPTYVRVLNEGYQAAYEKVRKERSDRAKRRKEEPSAEDLEVNRFDIGSSVRNRIWEQAMEAAWGGIDMDEFEERWKKYVADYL